MLAIGTKPIANRYMNPQALNPKPTWTLTYLFKDLHKEIIVRNPKKEGSFGSR